ncbi:hypothetical protein D9M71_740810 [compost metagenome]
MTGISQDLHAAIEQLTLLTEASLEAGLIVMQSHPFAAGLVVRRAQRQHVPVSMRLRSTVDVVDAAEVVELARVDAAGDAANAVHQHVVPVLLGLGDCTPLHHAVTSLASMSAWISGTMSARWPV